MIHSRIFQIFHNIFNMMIIIYDNMRVLGWDEEEDEDANVQKSNGEKTRNMCGTNKEIQLRNISVIESNAYGMQKSARPSPPLSAVSNKTATARTGEWQLRSSYTSTSLYHVLPTQKRQMFKQNTQNLDYNRAYQPCHTDCKFDENKKFYN